jgi:hypothetical protein
MTHLATPAAVSAGVSNTMSDIIDSLKRLERIGSENSKTVEKIIEAARNLEEKIVAQYNNSEAAAIDPIQILTAIAKEKDSGAVAAAKAAGLQYQLLCGMRYTIEWRTHEGRGLFISDGGPRVSANREAALRFASDVANGLLFLIENDLLLRQSEESHALEILERGSGPSRSKLPDEF